MSDEIKLDAGDVKVSPIEDYEAACDAGPAPHDVDWTALREAE